MRKSKEAIAFVELLNSFVRMSLERSDVPVLRVAIHCTKEDDVSPPYEAGECTPSPLVSHRTGSCQMGLRVALLWLQFCVD